MKILSFTIGEKRSRSSGISLELLMPDGRRAGLAFVDDPALAEKLVAARHVEITGGPA